MFALVDLVDFLTLLIKDVLWLFVINFEVGLIVMCGKVVRGEEIFDLIRIRNEGFVKD